MFSARRPGVALAALSLGMAFVAGSAGCSMKDGCKTDCQAPCEPECKPKPCKVCTPECCHPTGKILKLRAVNVPCTTDLKIGYKVETSHTCDDYDLLVRIEHCGGVVFERVIDLGRAYKTQGNGDRLFRGSITGKLTSIICGDRETFLAVGYLIPRAANGDCEAAIDREREHVAGSNQTKLGCSRIPYGWPPARSHEPG